MIDNIVITDINGNYNITASTPIIILYNIPIDYMSLVYDTIYIVDKQIYKYIKQKIFDDIFVPVSQIKENSSELYNVMFANTTIFPLASYYKEIKQNVWIGKTTISRTLYKTIGTIMSKTKPTIKYPVFPSYMLAKRDYKINNIYKDIYSDNSYGKWKLNTNKLTNNNFYSKLKMVENSNPWYQNNNIMGGAAHMKDSYKITGKENKTFKNESPNNIIYVMLILVVLLILAKQM